MYLAGEAVQFGLGATAVGVGGGAAMALSAATQKRRRSSMNGEGEAAESGRVVVQRMLQQLTYSKDTYGKPVDMRLTKHIVSQYAGAVQWVTYQWGKLTNNALATGTADLAYQLKYQEAATIPHGTLAAPASSSNASEFPFHIYSLCDRHNSNGSNDISGPGRFAYADTAANTPQLKFGWLQGLTNTSVPSNDWNVWSMYGSSSDLQLRSLDVTTSILKDVRVELLLQGAIGAPTTFHIDLISVSEDGYGPDASANLSRDEAYFPMIRKLLGNPVNSIPRGPKTSNTISVLKSWTYFMSPGTSIDYDTTPPQRHVTLDMHLNNHIKWNWQAEGPRIGRASYDDANVYTTRVMVNPNITITHYPPDYRDRKFLIVRATNTRPNVETGNTIPQYDIRIKTTHVFNVETN